MDDLMKTDLYELLNISINADEKEIKKAYRKKALTCHPDKNPDDPKAAELFQQLSKALEILTDAAAKSAYDKVLNARKAAELQHRELDCKRKRQKEARERKAKESKQSDDSQNVVERLNDHLTRQLKEEDDRLTKEVAKRILRLPEMEKLPRLKVKWNSHKNQEDNGGYNQEILTNIFQKYGPVTCFVSSRKKGSAIVEFSSLEAAIHAHAYEKGHAENPLMISWISNQMRLR